MPQPGHSTLREQSLSVQRLLNIVPYARIRIVHGQKQFCLLRDIAQVLHQRRTRLALLQVRFILAPATVLNDVRQCFLELLAIHFLHPLPTRFQGEPKTRLAFGPRSRSVSFSLARIDFAALWIRSLLSAARGFLLYLRAAFSALLSFSKSRSFMRAL